MRLIEYEVFRKGDDGKLHSEEFRYPEKVEEEKFREIYNRKVNNGMYVVARDILPKTLGPYLCRKHMGAETIAIYVKGRVFSTIEKAQFEGSHVADIGEIHRDFLMDVHCGAEKN